MLTCFCVCLFSWEEEQSFWHDSGFPSDQMIKYFTLSYDGTFVFVTEQEEVCILLYDFETRIYSYPETKAKNKFLMTHFLFLCFSLKLWWGQERTDSVFRLRPSQGWNELSHLQALSGDHSTLTVFYDGDKELQEVCTSTLTNSKYPLELGYNMKKVHE